MDKFSEEEQNEKELGFQSTETQDADDIQFEEMQDIDINKLQESLQKKIDNEGVDELTDEIGFEIKPGLQLSNTDEIPSATEQEAKKYVIYIEKDNIDFIESLSNPERRDVINKVLKEQNDKAIKKKEIERRKSFTTNIIIIVLTIIIGFPVTFALVNKGLLVTMENYQQAKDNFAKLYKTKGKIQPVEEKVENIKY